MSAAPGGGAAGAVVRVDARGMACPWPALRLARAMRGADRVTLLADDPAAATEVAALAAAHGWRLTATGGQYDLERRGS